MHVEHTAVTLQCRARSLIALPRPVRTTEERIRGGTKQEVEGVSEGVAVGELRQRLAVEAAIQA